uniref:Uncharacterized protein n=1 Tax=Lepeophtheirus salmonis TaxID=72036 RepID=A0A0K2TSL0_LEPSM
MVIIFDFNFLCPRTNNERTGILGFVMITSYIKGYPFLRVVQIFNKSKEMRKCVLLISNKKDQEDFGAQSRLKRRRDENAKSG